MNDVFKFDRFGNYFLYDLRNAWNNYGISLIIVGCLPIVMFALIQVTARFTTGAFIDNSLPVQIISIATAFLIVTLTFPAKVYGKYTEKRAGSAWLMLPASSFEKWLSLILITCVVLPVCFFAVLFISDGLLGVIFPNNWPSPLVSSISSLNAELYAETDGLVSVNWSAIAVVSWIENILCFVLGALIFKKAKVGKTFLALFVIGSLFSWISTLLFGFAHLTSGDLNLLSQDPDLVGLFNHFNLLISVIAILYIGGCAAGIFARIKTMKA